MQEGMQGKRTRTIDSLVRNEQALGTIRDLFFPAIKSHIVTGYNLYPDRPPSSYAYPQLEYYHSHLDPQDTHYQELAWILHSEGFLENHPHLRTRKARRRTLQRYAAYRHLPRWKKDGDMRIFTLEGRELTLEEAIEQKRDCIVEQKEYKLCLNVNTLDELRYLVNLFKIYASVFQLDSYGRRVPLHPGSKRFKKNVDEKGKNRHVEDSWEVPLITILNCQKPRSFRDFLHADLFGMDLRQPFCPFIEIITRSKKRELKDFLQARGIHPTIEAVYVLRTFLENYLER